MRSYFVRGDRDETDDVCVPASLLKKDSVRESAISRLVCVQYGRSARACRRQRLRYANGCEHPLVEHW